MIRYLLTFVVGFVVVHPTFAQQPPAGAPPKPEAANAPTKQTEPPKAEEPKNGLPPPPPSPAAASADDLAKLKQKSEQQAEALKQSRDEIEKLKAQLADAAAKGAGAAGNEEVREEDVAPATREGVAPREVMILSRPARAGIAAAGVRTMRAESADAKAVVDLVSEKLRKAGVEAKVGGLDLGGAVVRSLTVEPTDDGQGQVERVRVDVPLGQSEKVEKEVRGEFEVTYNRLWRVEAPVPEEPPAGVTRGSFALNAAASSTEAPTVNVGGIRAPEFWRAGYRGQGIKIAVVDSGVLATHSAFSGRVEGGWTYLSGGAMRPPAPRDGQTDLQGHGSHVAGIALGGAVVDAAGVRRDIGVAPGATLLPYCVMQPHGNTAVGYDNDIIAACHDAMNRGAKVINLSLGFNPGQPSHFQREWTQLIERAVEQNVLIVAASGNHQREAPNQVGPPANIPGVVSVGSVDDQGVRASYSVFNGSAGIPFIAAPGGIAVPRRNIASASFQNPIGLATMQGTSQAAPHIAGVAALLMNVDPRLKTSLPNLKAILRSHVAPGSARPEFGAGIVLLPKIDPNSNPDPNPNSGSQPPPIANNAAVLKRLKAYSDFWETQNVKRSEPIDD